MHPGFYPQLAFYVRWYDGFHSVATLIHLYVYNNYEISTSYIIHNSHWCGYSVYVVLRVGKPTHQVTAIPFNILPRLSIKHGLH